jgi:hypothetical protein
MGTWDVLPWDNDAAADWFGDLFERTDLASRVEQGLRLDAAEHFEEVRAAAAVLIMLGRTYIWPVDRLDKDLRLAIGQLQAVAKVPEFADAPEILDSLKREIEELSSRLTPGGESARPKPWWKFW